ncbi:hypothetical protein C8Q80DRAFT_1210805 [Daedaleopsis nitida]|nr:hypothetical protein C8Q80DRAFT_1210805 [Daedaleopsis nitida]
MVSPQLIDDSDPVVQYQSGWTWEPNVQDEVDHTRHWLNIDGITASLGFTGTGIQVVGTLMPSDGAGQPKTTYTIDGLSVGSYTAPFTSTTQYNVTYFTKRDLAPGSHTIIITSDFGTNGATFYLDYFLIYDQPPANSGPTTTTTTHTVPSSTSTTSPPHTNTQPSTSTSTFGSSPALSPSESATLSSSDTAISSSQSQSQSQSDYSALSLTPFTDSSTSTNAAASGGERSATMSSSASTQTVTLLGSASDSTATNSSPGTAVIVGAVLGGISLLVLIAITFFCARRRRRYQEPADVSPPFSRQMSETTHNWTTLSSSPSYPSGPTSESGFSESAYASPNRIPSSPPRRTSPPPAPASSSGSASISPSAIAGRRISSSAGDSKLPPSVYGATTIHTSSSAALISVSDHHSDPSTGDHPDNLIPPDTPQNFRSEIARSPWHAPPGGHLRAQSLLSAVSAGDPRAVVPEQEPSVEHYQDSGLRMYSETALPPPYTPE